MKSAVILSLAAACVAVAGAFRIESSPVAPPSDVLGEHQELQRTWTVYSEDALEKVHVAVPGPVFVSVAGAAPEPTATPEPTTAEPTATPEPTSTPAPTTAPAPTTNSSSSSGSGSADDADAIQFPTDDALALGHKKHKEALVATIVASGNSSALLELLEVVALQKDASNGVRVHLQNVDGRADGYLLTTITLEEKHAVRHVSAMLASSVDVASGVVVTDDSDNKIKIASTGATDVFITEEDDVHVNDLSVDVAGSGRVQWAAGGYLHVSGELTASVAGSGQVAFHADRIDTAQLKTTLSGDGAVFVVANVLAADALTTGVFGSGVASFNVANGSTHDHDVTVSGSGAVYAGGVVAKKTNADIWGSGVAYVSVTDKLKASTSYSGHVYYVGPRPEEIKTSGWFFWRSSVTAAEDNKIQTHALVDSPPVYPAYVALVTKAARHADEPNVELDGDSHAVSFAAVQSHVAAVVHGPNGLLVLSVMGVGVAALAMAAQSYQQHRVRRQYTMLV